MEWNRFYIHTYILSIHNFTCTPKGKRQKKPSLRRNSHHQSHWTLSDDRFQCSRQRKMLAKKQHLCVGVNRYMTSLQQLEIIDELFNEPITQFGLMFLIKRNMYGIIFLMYAPPSGFQATDIPFVEFNHFWFYNYSACWDVSAPGVYFEILHCTCYHRTPLFQLQILS